MKERKCFACDRRLGVNPYHASTEDGQAVAIGIECWKKLTPEGYQPKKGGPRLYKAKFRLDGFKWTVIEILEAPDESASKA